jgi:hypothetical protein
MELEIHSQQQKVCSQISNNLMWGNAERLKNRTFCEIIQPTVVHQIAGRYQIAGPNNSDSRKIWP